MTAALEKSNFFLTLSQSLIDQWNRSQLPSLMGLYKIIISAESISLLIY